MSLPWKETESTTEDMQRFCMKVKADVEKKIGKKSVFNSLTFRETDTEIQYIAKVHVGGTDCVHVKMSQTFPSHGAEVKFLDLQYPKKMDDEIQLF